MPNSESEQFSIAVRTDDTQASDPKNPEQQHPIASSSGIDDARVTKSETLVRRGKKWFECDEIHAAGLYLMTVAAVCVIVILVLMPMQFCQVSKGRAHERDRRSPFTRRPTTVDSANC